LRRSAAIGTSRRRNAALEPLLNTSKHLAAACGQIKASPTKHAEANVIRFLIILAGLLLAVPASAEGLDAALDRFASDDFSETETAIAEIAASGAPNAQAILEALSARRLLFADNRVVYQTEDGAYIDARTGKSAGGGDDLSPVRINNNLRGVIE